MRVSIRFVIGILILALGMSSVSLSATGAASGSTERLLVVFSGASIPFDAEDMVRGLGGVVVDRLPQIGVLVVEASGPAIDDLAAVLREQPGVYAVGHDLSVEVAPIGAAEESADGPAPEYVASSNPMVFPPPGSRGSMVRPYDYLYTSTNGQWSVKRVGGTPATWAFSEGAGVKIAIVDTGVATTHPDIAPNLDFAVSLVNVSADSPKCDDGSAYDQLGHGTMVASVAAAAVGPGTGLVVGVAPKARIRSYKVLRRVASPLSGSALARCGNGRGAGNVSWIIQGIVQAAEDGADIINVSAALFINKTDVNDVKTIYTVMLRGTNHAFAQGSLIVASAGNGAMNMNALGPIMHLPSELPNVINVAATTNPDFPPPGMATGDDYLASYSNYGSSLHGLAAPGGDVPFPPNERLVQAACSPGVPGTLVGLPSTGRSFGCSNFPGPNNHVWYARFAGTSFAAPHVAGVAALIKAANPALKPSQIRAILQQTAFDLGKRGYDEFFNHGMPNAFDAVQRALR